MYNNSDTIRYKHRLLSISASAQTSIVSGSGIANIAIGTTVNIIVTAYDLNSNQVLTGGDAFIVKISNLWTKYNEYYWSPNGIPGPLSTNINDIMTDHNNGTYSYSYSISNAGMLIFISYCIGSISVQVYLMTQGKVYQEFFGNTGLSGSPIKNWVANYLSFDGNTSGFWISNPDHTSANIIAWIRSPYTGKINFTAQNDDGFGVSIDDSSTVAYKWNKGVHSDNFNYNFEIGKFYTFYGQWCQIDGLYNFTISWNYPTITKSEIPNSSIYLQSLAGSSPYNINVLSSLWGDGFKSESEEWDDNNINDGDGWSSSCSIETGWNWSGGSISTKDIWTEIWDDGKRFNSIPSYCDDGNTFNGDGCSSVWSVESGWNWSGGNSNTKDICIEIWGDGKRFNRNDAYWDDSNQSNGDGWSSSCQIESGWTWSGGDSSTKDTYIKICGDGKRFNSNNTCLIFFIKDIELGSILIVMMAIYEIEMVAIPLDLLRQDINEKMEILINLMHDLLISLFTNQHQIT